MGISVIASIVESSVAIPPPGLRIAARLQDGAQSQRPAVPFFLPKTHQFHFNKKNKKSGHILMWWRKQSCRVKFANFQV